MKTLFALVILISVNASAQFKPKLFVVGDSKSLSTAIWIPRLTDTAKSYTDIGYELSKSGWTVANARDSVAAHLLKFSTVPDLVLINLGVNDVGAGTTRVNYVQAAQTLVSSLHTRWPNVTMYMMRVYSALVSSSGCDSVDAYIETVVSSYPFLRDGPDERVWFKDSDNAASESSDGGTHYSDLGMTLCAGVWKTTLAIPNVSVPWKH